MPFYSLSPVNFRNLKNETINIFSKEVFFTGENGQGKSNLLEALYFASYGSSFRTHVDSEMTKKGESEMSVRVLYKGSLGDSHSTSIKFFSKGGKSSKKMEKDGKIIRDRKELLNTMPCVLYSHDDLEFVSGAPERRRFFIDQTLSMYDVLYVDILRRYKQILKSRNQCIKDKQFNLLDTYDTQLAAAGLEIEKRRSACVFKFNQIFTKLYYEVSGLEGVCIRYCPAWRKDNCSKNSEAATQEKTGGYNDNELPPAQDVISYLQGKRQSDIVMNTTLSGPHRDRIGFTRKGEAFVPQASMGQRRLVALVLRTAQAQYYTQETGRLPVLLMDDVLLELDPEKRQRMTSLLPQYDQLFCTFLPGEPYENYKTNDTLVYTIKDGGWQQAE